MKKYIKVIGVITVTLGICISILYRVLLPGQQENPDLPEDFLQNAEDSDRKEFNTETSGLISQQDGGELQQSNTKVALYLQEELVWEMGKQAPQPVDFFRAESVGKVDGLGKGDVAQFVFVTPLTDEMLHTKGKYRVEIDCKGTVVDARLSVVDTTPPEITAPGQVQYEVGDVVLYKKGVSVIDNSGEDLELMLDSSEVKSNMAGTYKVYYSAVDSSGNIGRAETEVIIQQGHQPTAQEVDALADELLDSILTEDMTQLDQAEAIFDWVRNHVRYTADADKSSLVQGAYDGIHHRTGDCYTYFATAAYLMDRCAIENLPVTRKSEGATHYWNLVNVGSGWYHFDSSPHKNGYRCFMQTDAQVKEYAQKNEREEDYFTFDETGMPDRAEEVIYNN